MHYDDTIQDDPRGLWLWGALNYGVAMYYIESSARTPYYIHHYTCAAARCTGAFYIMLTTMPAAAPAATSRGPQADAPLVGDGVED